MFAQMRYWWDQFDIAAEQKRERERLGFWMGPLGRISYRDFAAQMLEVLRLVVIPRIQGDAETITGVVDLVDSVAECELPIAAALPAMRTIQPDRDILPEMRRSLASYHDDFYSSALEGLVHWVQLRRPEVELPTKAMLPELPGDLPRELGMIVATRRQPGLLEALRIVAWLLQNYSQAVADNHFLQSIIVALEYLWAETEYRSFGSESDRVPYSEVPQYRKEAARIASIVRKTACGEAKILHQWLEAASDDPLPEIRRAVVDVEKPPGGIGRAISIDELVRLLQSSIRGRASAEEAGRLVDSLTPVLQQSEFASIQGTLPLEQKLQLASLLLVRITQMLSSATAVRSATKAIVSYLADTPDALSRTDNDALTAVARQDDVSHPDETLLWLRQWVSRSKKPGGRRKRSDRGQKSARK